MYIEPNSTIHVLHGIPIDPSYEHTIWFDSLIDQYVYFAGKKKYTYEKYSYQRHTVNVIRVEQNANALFDCNYLMFQNVMYGPKWFYAFITDIEYINDNVAAIHYEIDVLQTWLFGGQAIIEPCFVQREHSETDNIGENLVPENMELGDYIVTSSPDGIMHTYMGSNSWSNGSYTGGTPDPDDPTQWRENEWCVVVMLNSYILGTLPCHLNYTGGTAHQCCYKIFSCDDSGYSNADQWLQTFSWSRLSEAISAIYMFPKRYLPDMTYDNLNDVWWGSSIPNNGYLVGGNPYILIERDYNNVYGFTPQNNKLYTYPYYMLRVGNGEGVYNDYKWERFAGEYAAFNLFGSLSANPSITLFPTGYKNNGLLVEQEKMLITSFPTVTHPTNDFTAKLVQKTMGLALTAIGASVGGGAGAMLGGSAGATTETTKVSSATKARNPETGRMVTTRTREHEITQSRERQYENEAKLGKATASVAKVLGETRANACVGDSNTNLSVGMLDFTFYKTRITDEFAHIIDDFFSMYGYATNRVKVPNTHSRPHWNYVKTTNCNIHG